MLTRRAALTVVASAALVPPDALATIHPDATLLQLGSQFEAEWAKERELWAAAKLHPWPDPAGIPIGEQAEAQFERTSELVDRIADMPALTLEGLRIKARALAWCHGGDSLDQMLTSSFSDTRLLGSIVRDVAGAPLAS